MRRKGENKRRQWMKEFKEIKKKYGEINVTKKEKETDST